MADEIERAGGTVEKFAGDAVMAAFGAPAALEDHAERALHAALAMQRRLPTLFDGELALRIGVNTGEVVVGRAARGQLVRHRRRGQRRARGSSRRRRRARSSSASARRRLCAARSSSASRDASRRRASRAASPAAALVRALSLMRPRGVRRPARARSSGGTRELELLQATYARAVEQRRAAPGHDHRRRRRRQDAARARAVGAGSRTQSPAAAAPHRAAASRTATASPTGRSARSSRSTSASSRASRRRRVRERLGEPRDPRPRARPRRRPASCTRSPRATGSTTRWVEFLERARARAPGRPARRGPPLGRGRRCSTCSSAASRDVRGPLLVIATARPELLDARPAWGGGTRNASLLWLEPLPPAETAAAARRAARGRARPTPCARLIVERAEGNPFFVEELLATLIDRGVLARRDGGWTCAELPADFESRTRSRPCSRRGSTCLPPAEKAALQAACGDRARLLDRAGATSCSAASSPTSTLLEERDFVRRRPGSSFPGEREYAIKHALTREVAYAQPPEGEARRSCTPRSRSGSSARREARDEHALAARAPLRGGGSPRGRRSRLGRDETTSSSGCARRRSHGCERAAELAVGRYEIDDGARPLQRALELEPRPASASGALALDRPRQCAQVRRAAVLAGDGAGDRPLRRRGPAGRSLRRSRAADCGSIGMWPVLPESEVLLGWIDRALELAPAESVSRAKALARPFDVGGRARRLWRGTELSRQALWPSARESRAPASSRGPAGLLRLRRWPISRRRSPWR